MTRSAISPTPGPVPHLSVVVPVYLGQACLDELYRRLVENLEPLSPDFEIVLVEDAGPDDSWAGIERLAELDPRVRGIQLARNFGQHHAITAGLKASRGEWIVVMDCDLQDRPEEIPKLYARAQEGHPCVMARRVTRQDGWRKRMTSAVFYRTFNYLTDLDYDGSVANFCIVSRGVVDQLDRMNESVRFFGGFLSWMGFQTAFVDVEHGARHAGESSYTLRKLFGMAIPIILAHSNKPLRMCVAGGLSIAALSLLAGAYLFLRALIWGSPVMGWPSLIVTIFGSTGVIVLTLGILGLYIDRIFDEVKRRPLYVERRRTWDDRAA